MRLRRLQRAGIICLLLSTLTACASIPHFQDPAAQLFGELFDAPASARAEILRTLQQTHPDSPWTTRGEAVQESFQKQRDLARRLKTLNEEKAQCRRQQSQLEREKRALEEDLEKLKQLVIEMELRASP